MNGQIGNVVWVMPSQIKDAYRITIEIDGAYLTVIFQNNVLEKSLIPYMILEENICSIKTTDTKKHNQYRLSFSTMVMLFRFINLKEVSGKKLSCLNKEHQNGMMNITLAGYIQQ
jgi:hypothetical protein